MKSANMISATGRMPTMAAPAQVPMMAASDRGVSRTRSAPYLASRPLVTPKSPPISAMSSPMRNISACFSMARSRALLRAWVKLVLRTRSLDLRGVRAARRGAIAAGGVSEVAAGAVSEVAAGAVSEVSEVSAVSEVSEVSRGHSEVWRAHREVTSQPT